MRTSEFKSKAILKAALLAAILLLGAGASFGQQTINLTAAPTTTRLPDGTTVPMWGYFCGTAVAPTTGLAATCAALNPNSVATATAAATWSPVVITVPASTTAGVPTSLTINLTNNLLFTPTTTGATPNAIPTSLVIVGQVGGGLGVVAQHTTTLSPDHSNAQGCVSWFIAAIPPGTPCSSTNNQGLATPPAQLPRVQSMAAEVTAVAATPAATCTAPTTGAVTGCATLLWPSLKPGTYLLESGTHPSIQVPMGLIGMLVVTTAPAGTAAGTAYPGALATTSTAAIPAVTYNAEVPLEFSEIDPVQNNAVNTAVNTAGFLETNVWSGMIGQCGNPSSPVGVVNTCYPPAVNYTPFYYLINGLAFNKTNAGFSVFPATANGIGTFPPLTTVTSGTVLVRLVNAGLRMHVPSIVGSQTAGFTGAGAPTTPATPVGGFALIAEDGNVIPNVAPPGATTVPAAPRVQTDVFMAAGKTFDVMINAVNVPAATSALPVYARDLGLSANSSARDAGMLAYIGINGSGLPVAAGTGIFGAAAANPDIYNSLIAGQPFTVSDPSKGVIANDVNVYGVHLLTAPTSGTLTCPAVNAFQGVSNAGICANGTFTYTPTNAAATTVTADSFTYCANNAFTPATATTAASCSSTVLTATVSLNAASLEATGGITCAFPNPTYTSNESTHLKIASPGVLAFCRDAAGYPLKVCGATGGSACPTGASAPALSGGTLVTMDVNGGFVVSGVTGATAQLTFTPQNSQGVTGAQQSVPISFPAPSNLQIAVVDAAAYQAAGCTPANAVVTSTGGVVTTVSCTVPVTTGPTAGTTTTTNLPAITDYRWIIEEDKTFWVDPNCTTNVAATAPGCPHVVGPSGTSTIPSFAVNFHTSNMDYVAQGCTGTLSCEGGQTFLNPATGTHVPAVCDVGNGACRPDPNCAALPCTTGGVTPALPSSVHLDPSKRYYISVLPGDAANPFPANTNAPSNCLTGEFSGTALNTGCGHTMTGAPIPAACNINLNTATSTVCSSTTTQAFAPVTVLSMPTPLPTGKLSVIVFEDDNPVNGEQDAGGGTNALAPNEPGLGGFNIILWDTYGSLGDVTGQDSYDAFNQPLSNSLAGTIDPATGLDACPLSTQATQDPTQAGITGMIVTCPKYESDGATLSPLAGQAVIANLMQDKFSVQAYPGADRIARGEEWLQTNTLDGQHPHDSFIRLGEPSYFQEYGPAGYHVSIGFVNPAIVNARHAAVCAGVFGAVGSCSNTIEGQVDVQRLSRTPDQRLYPSGSRDALIWTQCWVSLGDPDAEDFMFTKCDANGNFKFLNVPGGEWRLTIGDQWNDQIIDGLSTPASVGITTSSNGNPAPLCPGTGSTVTDCNLGQIGVQQWQSNIYTRTFVDDNKNGIFDSGEIGIPLIYTFIHYRDGSRANALTTDFSGIASFNETFPLFNWYAVETDTGRYKTTGIHTVYDAGGPADGSPSCGGTARLCGTSANNAYNFLANTYESVPLPADLSVPGAVYCAHADCTTEATTFALGTAIPSSPTAGLSTGRIDPPWVTGEGWSGLTSQGNWIDFGKAPYAICNPALPASATNFCVSVPNPLYNPTVSGTTTTTPSTVPVGENGGIIGDVVYAATRPFDSAEQMIIQPWEPHVPNVTMNLYQESVAADGVTPTLTLVDTTKTSSWDAWAQGFWPGAAGTTGIPVGGTGATAGQKPYMSCPGQGLAPTTANPNPPNADLFFFTLFDQPNYLDAYNAQHNGGTLHPLPYNSQFKCYDAMHIWNQLQPAPYDGKYQFPSVLGINQQGKLDTTLTGGVGGNGPATAGFKAASMPGTNCTICVANPDTTDLWRVGTPMLPPGKYVVEVVMPPGYEVYKEEDKNLLIGDNYIAPVTNQFGGLGGDIFIIPDQASVASMYDPNANGFNPTNFQNQTTNLDLQGGMLSGVPGFPGFQDPVWPCVGEMRVVPDYLSEFPQAQETGPFAGATRPLCDRKEVTLASQTSSNARFFIFTSTHIASKFTGTITDDYTSEFDPFAPQFGEKFAPPNQPISTRDYLGNEISRVYSDLWGIYNGLTFSSWEVNPPNITGYSPSMMVQCMNDPGPILDTNPLSPTHGKMINDPLYNPAYSDFCYEEPYMPGLTNYTDTPVVPTQAFVGAGYNTPDCAYPDATPAIAEVDGDGVGPWVSTTGHRLTITALGNATTANTTTCTAGSTGADVSVNNYGYAGPSASVAPFDCKTVTRHYGFGPSQGTGSVALIGTAGNGTATVPLSQVSWSDTTITGTVPTAIAQNPHFACPMTQQAQYGGSPARCGQLVITAANGKQSIDTVTVTVGGKAPTHVGATGSVQAAIDAAAPGDLIIVDPTCTATTGAVTTCATASATNVHIPASHTEMLIMWKPVRLQGVGAATTIVNANTHPAGKLLDPWRAHVNCLFGLTMQGVPSGNTTPFNPTGVKNPNTGQPFACPDTSISGDAWNNFSGMGQVVGATGTVTTGSSPQIDRLPLEATVGWDATLNGNLAEQLQEPSLMGAYEGAGVTVLGKSLEFHGASPWSDGTEGGAFPTGTTLLMPVGNVNSNANALPVGDPNPFCHTGTYNATTGVFTPTSLTAPNPYPSNFMCNPSSIDGLTITNSSQGGGGIFVHGWAHNLQIANNRVYNNAGTLSGGISVGQGEFAGPYPVGGLIAAPGSCSNGVGFVTNQDLPMCLQLDVNVHHNMITDNSSLGDELFSATLAGGGGATFCTGNDYYKFNYNWVCGNLSSGEGGGVVHLGEIFYGDIEKNSIIFNQSTNPTIPTNGGGIMVQGTPDTDPVCGNLPDADCPPGLSNGTGPGLVINANLIQGNFAESGSGGGIRLQSVDGTQVSALATGTTSLVANPGSCADQAHCLWNLVTITNNVIINNVAGWDGAGVSMQDALVVNLVNNTIAHNDSTASSGVLNTSLGAPLSSAPGGNCGNNVTGSCPQVSGLVVVPNTAILTATFANPPGGTFTLVCPPGHFTGGSGTNGTCRTFSYPLMFNDVFWENRSFYIGVGNYGGGTQNQQKLVSLFDAFTSTAAPSQGNGATAGVTGSCSGTPAFPASSYWDIGVRGDSGPGNHSGGTTLNPQDSILTSSAGYAGSNTTSFTPVAQYCNGSRVAPECTVADGCGGLYGFGVPPGIADAVTPNPVFGLTPAATVDEGNNWINMSWGPLSLTNPSITGGAPYNNYGGGPLLGNYTLGAATPNGVTSLSGVAAPTTDFFGNARGTPNRGAVQGTGAGIP